MLVERHRRSVALIAPSACRISIALSGMNSATGRAPQMSDAAAHELFEIVAAAVFRNSSRREQQLEPRNRWRARAALAPTPPLLAHLDGAIDTGCIG